MTDTTTTTTEARPQPVLNTQLIAQGAAIVLSLLVTLGLISTDQSDVLTGGVGYALGAVPVVAAIIGAFHGRKAVTPSAAPVDSNGEPLASTAELRKVAGSSYANGLAAGRASAGELASVPTDDELTMIQEDTTS